MAVHSLCVSAFSALSSFSTCTSTKPSHSLPIPSLSFLNLRSRSHDGVSCSWFPTLNQNNPPRRLRKLRSADEETTVPEQEDEQPTSQQEADGEPSSSSEEQDQQPVSVPVSPSDTLTMFFQVLFYGFFFVFSSDSLC